MLGFLLSIRFGAQNRFVEIDEMTVKFGTVYASVLNLSAHRQTATSAHTRAVHHKRVHTHNGVSTEGFGKRANGVHHHKRTYRKHAIELASVFHELFKHIGYEPFFTARAVVGDEVQF